MHPTDQAGRDETKFKDEGVGVPLVDGAMPFRLSFRVQPGVCHGRIHSQRELPIRVSGIHPDANVGLIKQL